MFCRDVEKDPRRAAVLYHAACEGGDGAGCTNLGEMYATGKGVEKDNEKARLYFQKGCETGSSWGCDVVRDACLL